MFLLWEYVVEYIVEHYGSMLWKSEYVVEVLCDAELHIHPVLNDDNSM